MNQPIRLHILVDATRTRRHLDAMRRLLDYSDPGTIRIDSTAITFGETPVPDSAFTGSQRIALPRLGARWSYLAERALRRHLAATPAELLCLIGPEARLLGGPVGYDLNLPAAFAYVDDLGFDLKADRLEALRRAGQLIGRYIATSYAAAQRLRRQEGADRQHIDIIPRGVDVDRFPERTEDRVIEAKHALGFSRDQQVIVLAGGWDRGNNIATFLGAMGHLKPLLPNARFVLIGTGTVISSETLKRDIAERDLDDRITVSPDPRTLEHWLPAADIGVLTSYAESCSSTLLTYMAAGLPIVATRSGGNSEMINHDESGYLCNPFEEDQLASYLMLLLLSTDLGVKFGRAARVRAASLFSAANEASRISDYLRTLAIATRPRIMR